MKLFEIIHEKFFNILSSPLKAIYADCLFLIYNEYRLHSSFGINREILTQILADYFEGLEEDILFEDDSENNEKSPREKANYFIRKLNEYGWIDIETTSSYEQIINLHDYAVSIIETLDKIIKNERLEYQGYVYTIYSILFSNENIQNNIVLEQAYENTVKLINGLKTLNANIKKYIEKVTEQKTSEKILKLHFEGYSLDIIDKGYHRLKTSDHVSKFRPRILEKLEELKQDKEFINKACELEVSMERAKDLQDAHEKIYKRLDETITAFSNMDQIIDEIDRKNTQYIRASLTRIKYLLNSTKDIAGQIIEILKYLALFAQHSNSDITDEYFEEIEELFNLYPQSFIDEKSLYRANEGKKTFIPQSLEKNNILSEEEREKHIQLMKEKKARRMSRVNVDKYVLELLEEREIINASMLPLQNTTDFIRLIYILIYSKSKLVHYKIKKSNSLVHKNEFHFNDFEIWRK